MDEVKKSVLYHGNDHIYGFPVFKKVIDIADNGDQTEKFEEVSPEELRKHRSLSLFNDIINGTQVTDVSHFDKFQLMDALEKMIDDIPDEQIDEILGRKHE